MSEIITKRKITELFKHGGLISGALRTLSEMGLSETESIDIFQTLEKEGKIEKVVLEKNDMYISTERYGLILCKSENLSILDRIKRLFKKSDKMIYKYPKYINDRFTIISNPDFSIKSFIKLSEVLKNENLLFIIEYLEKNESTLIEKEGLYEKEILSPVSRIKNFSEMSEITLLSETIKCITIKSEGEVLFEWYLVDECEPIFLSRKLEEEVTLGIANLFGSKDLSCWRYTK